MCCNAWQLAACPLLQEDYASLASELDTIIGALGQTEGPSKLPKK